MIPLHLSIEQKRVIKNPQLPKPFLSRSNLTFNRDMKIWTCNEGHLTNCEVLQILLEKQTEPRENQAADSSEKKAELRRCRDVPEDAKIEAFKHQAMQEFGLMEAEILQLINLRPDSESEIPLIVECCEDRLSVEQIEKLVLALSQIFQ